MIDALTKNKTADKKRDIEAEVAAWIEADPVRKAVYGDIFQTMQDYYAATAASTAALQYLSQAGLSGSTVSSVAWQLGTIFSSPQYSDSLRGAFIERLPKYYERLDMNLEKRLSTELMKHIVKNVPDSLLPAVLSARIQEIGVDSLAAAMETSLLFCPEKLQAALKDDPEVVLKDPAIEVFKSYYDQYLALNQKNREIVNSFNRADRLFHAALQKAFEGRRVFYPDANFTMRLTYGNILPYDPKDGVTYHYETTLDGVAQKYKKGDPEFDAPQKLLDLNAARDYGQYANSKGQLITCFLSNLDITGGNSGSPVINGRGELIGIAFDGNWEAMSGDIEFEPNLQRTISVDIRYVLFVIDKVMGAQNILDELTIVNVPQDAKLKNAKSEKPEKVKKAKKQTLQRGLMAPNRTGKKKAALRAAFFLPVRFAPPACALQSKQDTQPGCPAKSIPHKRQKRIPSGFSVRRTSPAGAGGCGQKGRRYAPPPFCPQPRLGKTDYFTWPIFSERSSRKRRRGRSTIMRSIGLTSASIATCTELCSSARAPIRTSSDIFAPIGVANTTREKGSATLRTILISGMPRW